MIEQLFTISQKLSRTVSLDFKRSLYEIIDWSQKLIEIQGARGVGKTTLMLQKVRELNDYQSGSALYISLDDPYFYEKTVIETAEEFSKYGGKFLFVDEIHKYPSKQKQYDWAAELKNVYDLYPEILVVYSGSSIIQLYKGNADLSRRKTIYHLKGLSFREYLAFNDVYDFPAQPLELVLQKHMDISQEITEQIKILPHFRDYLHHGYYPFYNENPNQYFDRISRIINVILEVDIPSVTEITFEIIGKIKKMLAVLASSVPYTPNLTRLSADLNIADLRTLYKYLSYLEHAELIIQLLSGKAGYKIMQKPSKLLLNNTNLFFALFTSHQEIGTIREVFFGSQLKNLYPMNYPDKGDFLIDGKYIMEIGGKNKKEKQIANVENAFLILDDIELGFANKVPLWLMGFLY